DHREGLVAEQRLVTILRAGSRHEDHGRTGPTALRNRQGARECHACGLARETHLLAAIRKRRQRCLRALWLRPQASDPYHQTNDRSFHICSSLPPQHQDDALDGKRLLLTSARHPDCRMVVAASRAIIGSYFQAGALVGAAVVLG